MSELVEPGAETSTKTLDLNPFYQNMGVFIASLCVKVEINHHHINRSETQIKSIVYLLIKVLFYLGYFYSTSIRFFLPNLGIIHDFIKRFLQ